MLQLKEIKKINNKQSIKPYYKTKINRICEVHSRKSDRFQFCFRCVIVRRYFVENNYFSCIHGRSACHSLLFMKIYAFAVKRKRLNNYRFTVSPVLLKILLFFLVKCYLRHYEIGQFAARLICQN